MKKILLSSLFVTFGVGAFAQSSVLHNGQFRQATNYPNTISKAQSNIANKTTSIDTVFLTNESFDTTNAEYIFGSDSGFVFGTNVFNLKGFAQRYDLTSSDTPAVVIGALAVFYGTVTPASTKTISIKVWNMDAPTSASATLTYSGFPSTVIDSQSFPITQLGINDTALILKEFDFTTPTSNLTGSFFIGYDMNYTFATLAGDTIAMGCSPDGARLSVPYVVASGDTLVNVQNATQFPDGTWLDNGFDIGLNNDLMIYPICLVPSATGVAHITKNNFSFFGNFPNPAVNSTNIKVSLAKGTNVTVQIMDMAGRVINTINQNNLSAGEHLINVSTATMPAGEYLYTIRTAEGDGIASKLSVIK